MPHSTHFHLNDEENYTNKFLLFFRCKVHLPGRGNVARMWVGARIFTKIVYAKFSCLSVHLPGRYIVKYDNLRQS